MKSWRRAACMAGSVLVLLIPQDGFGQGPHIELAQTLTAPGEPLDKRETPEGSPAAGGVLPEAGVKTREAGQALTVDGMLAQLSAMNVTYSVRESDIREWLANADYTPYPAVATGLIDLLRGKRLQKALDLDVIVYDYESTAGVQSPRKAEDVKADVLTAAVLKGYNARHGVSARDLSQITE